MTEIPNIQGELVGFRGWYVNDDLGLESQTEIKTVWAPGENVAACERQKYEASKGIRGFYISAGLELKEVPTDSAPQHEAPNHECGCGLYAHHKPNRLKRPSWDGAFTWLTGIVTLYGRVEVHASHEGMRSSKSRIAALELPEGRTLRAIAKAVATEYGVPLVPADELERVASEFGQRCPEEYFPEVKVSDEAKLYSPRSNIQTFYRGSGSVSRYYSFGGASGLWQAVPTGVTFNQSYTKAQEVDPGPYQKVKPKKRKPKRNSARQGPPSSRGAQFNQNRKK